MRIIIVIFLAIFINDKSNAESNLLKAGHFSCTNQGNQFFAYVEKLEGSRARIHFTLVDRSIKDGCPSYIGPSCSYTGITRNYMIKTNHNFMIRNIKDDQFYYPMQTVSSELNIFQKISIPANQYYGKWKKIKSKSRYWHNLASLEVLNQNNFEISFPSIHAEVYRDPYCGCSGGGTKFEWNKVQFNENELSLARCQKKDI